MNKTESTGLQQGDERAYEAMATAVQTSVSELLVPFKAAADAEALLKTMSSEEFFQKFLVHADQFTGRCCQEYAKIMRECALVPEIRGTPTVILAKGIRAEAFEPLDNILVRYIQSLKQLGLDLGMVSTELHDSSVISAALKGAAVGQVAGGFGSSGKTLGALNALIQAGTEAEKKLVLLQQRAELLKQAGSMTYQKIAEYLEAVIQLPERLLDYGCARCFGSQVSLERQRQALEGVQALIAQELEPAVRLTLALPNTAKRLEQQRFETAKAEEEARQKQQELDSKKPAPGVGICLVVMSLGMFAWGLKNCDLDTASEEEMIFGMVLIVGAVFAFVAGIMRFFDRRPKSAVAGSSRE